MPAKYYLLTAMAMLVVGVASAVPASSGITDSSQIGPESLLKVASLSGRVTALTRLGNTLLASVGGHVYSMDLTTNRVLAQKVVDGTSIESLQAHRGRALADSDYGIYSLDVKDPRNLRSYYLTSEVRLRNSAIVGDYALQPSVRLNIVYLNGVDGLKLVGEYRRVSSPVAIDVAGRLAYVGMDRGGLVALDVTNPELPQPLGHITPTQRINALAAMGSAVYLFGHGGGYYSSGFSDSGGELTICDFSDPMMPGVVSQLVLPRPDRIAQSLWAPNQLLIVDGYAYIFTANAGLAIVDVRRPSAPRLVQPFDQHTLTNEALRVGSRVYIARSDADLEVLDIRDPEHPKSIERIRFPNGGDTVELAVADKRLYVAAEEDSITWIEPWSRAKVPPPKPPEYQLRIVDVADPLLPTVLGTVTTAIGEYTASYGRRDTIHVVGDRVVLLVKNDLVTVDVSDPTRPEVTSRLDLPGSPRRLELLGSLGLVGDGSDQFLLVDLAQPDQPSILRSVTLPSAAADWGVVRGLVYLISPPERPPDNPNRQPRRSTLYLLSIDACGGVKTVAQHPFLHVVGSITLSSAVLDEYIYFGSSSLHIFDVSDPKEPEEVFVRQGVFGLFGGGVVSARDDTLILRITSDNGCMVAVFDIGDRVQPRHIGSQYTSYATCSRDAVAMGGYVYFANTYDGLTVNLPLLPGLPTPTPRSDPTEWPPPTPGPTRPGTRPTRTATAINTRTVTSTATRTRAPAATAAPLPRCEPTDTTTPVPAPTDTPASTSSPTAPAGPRAIILPFAAFGN